MKKVELLAPAGSMESLKAAVNAGADAVYLGGMKFGARAYADNLTQEDLKLAIDYAHLHGVSLYLTVNTLFKEQELAKELYPYLLPLYEQGLDAVIVQDIGALCALREWFPDLPVHVSTQMTVTGAEGFSFLRQFPNVTRIVTARELSLAEIRTIRSQTDLEIESFIHGALCYCYSGQCLLSSLIGGRSGNRGRCAQPCRLPYEVRSGGQRISSEKERYILSPKDMNTLEILPQLLEAGIDSLKIEGRMKRPEYTAGVVSIYRRYLDLFAEQGTMPKAAGEDIAMLEELFRKRGYSRGFYEQHNGRNMMALSAPSPEKEEAERSVLMDSLAQRYIKTEKKEKIKGFLEVSTEKPVKLLLQWKEFQVSVTGEAALTPKSRAMTAADFEKQLRKTGNTPFEFETLDIAIDGEVFVPNGSLNELRRKGLALLKQTAAERYRRATPEREQRDERQAEPVAAEAPCERPEVHIAVETQEQLAEALAFTEADAVLIDSSLCTMSGLKKYCGGKKKIYYILPAVFRAETAARFTKEYEGLKELPWDGFVVKNLESYQWLLEMKNEKPVITDANLYTFNSRAARFWQEQPNVVFETLPAELNSRELKMRGCRKAVLPVYGHQAVMVSAGCVYQSLRRCRKAEKTPLSPEKYFRLRDRKNAEFAVKPVCRECYNLIYNSIPLSLFGCLEQVEELGASVLRLSFTLESAEEMRGIFDTFRRCFINREAVSEDFAFTRGHFRRGVE